jgi:hypothetical protein
MAVKLKYIPGALVEKDGQRCNDCGDCEADSIISQQGEVQIGINREKLAKVLFNYVYPERKYENCEEYQKKSFRQEADAIIANEKEILEVNK